MKSQEAILHVANLLIDAVEALGALIDQPDPEVIEKEAVRVERPLELKSVPGVIITK